MIESAPAPWRRRSAAALVAAALATGGCALVVSFDDVTLGGSGSGGGGAGGGGGGGGAGGEGGGVVAPEECTIFVAPSGEDDADGRELGRPLRTLGRAIELAAESASSVEETVCVCGGKVESELYVEPEPLHIDRSTSLRGSYDCQTWQRPDLEGDEQVRGRGLTTVVRGGGVSGATLSITGGLGPEVVVDGLAFGPALTGDDGSATVVIAAASPTFSDNFVAGPVLSAGTAIGLVITESSEALVRRCYIDGGAGDADDPATPSSIGVAILNASPTMERSVVFGGGGDDEQASGSVGVYVGGDSLALLALDAITGGSGLATNGAGSVGLRIAQGASALVGSCAIHGGSGDTFDNALPASAGVLVDVNSTLDLWRSVVYGGDRPNTSIQLRGAVIVNGGLAHLESNMLHAGRGHRTVGVIVADGQADLFHNTIYAGYAVAPPVPDMFGLWVFDGTTTMVHNLIFGEAAPNSWALQLGASGVGSLGDFQGNAFVGLTNIEQGFDTFADLQTALGGAATDNLWISASCPEDDPICYEGACTDDGPTCGQLTFDDAQQGFANVWGGASPGFLLVDGASCLLTAVNDATVVEPSPIADFFDTPFESPHSIGAHVYPGPSPCVPP